LKGRFDKEKAASFDLLPKDLGFNLTLFHIDHNFSGVWQYRLKTTDHLEITNIDSVIFPTETAIAEILKQICENHNPEFAIIQTDYFGGVGNQYANVFTGTTNTGRHISTINQALKHLGVSAKDGLDEFDTVGLGKIRSQPDYLDKYRNLAEDYDL